MTESVSFQEFPSVKDPATRKSKIIIGFIILLLIIVGILIGLYLLGARAKKIQLHVSPVPTPEATVVPTATPIASASATVSPSFGKKTSPTPSITVVPTRGKGASSGNSDRSRLQIAVLNGSGIPGAAKQMSSALSSLGYTVKTVGNADNFSYQGVTIKVTKNLGTSDLSLLKQDVTANASSATVSVVTDNTIAEDAEVIVGK